MTKERATLSEGPFDRGETRASMTKNKQISDIIISPGR